jgi:putative transposase
LPVGENTIDFQLDGASEGILVKNVEDTRNPHFQLATGVRPFSVSQSHVDAVIWYIENQEEHHRTITFEEEFRLILKRYRVAFDERYVWD